MYILDFEFKQLEGGQNFNARFQCKVRRGGGKNVARDYRGGQVLSTSDFQNSTAPHSLNSLHYFNFSESE